MPSLQGGGIHANLFRRDEVFVTDPVHHGQEETPAFPHSLDIR